MTSLLVTLGSTPQVVPEAFVASGFQYHTVDVLTTASPGIDLQLLRDFFADQPGVSLNIWRMASIDDVGNAAQQQIFEEVFLRWYLLHRRHHADLHLCLSGGRKAMSATAQKTAIWFGAARVFHVLAPDTMRSAEDIRAGISDIQCVDLGAEPGWPSLNGLQPTDFPLQTDRRDSCLLDVSAPVDDELKRVLAGKVDLFRLQVDGFARAGSLPFPSLAMLPPAASNWLGQPLDGVRDASWIQDLPKIELHCHLGGFATHGAELARVREAAQSPPPAGWLAEPAEPEGWPLPPNPCGLDAYMHLGDANGTTLLRDPGCLHAQCQMLHAHLSAQNIAYAEIRCSPGNYATPQRRASVVLQDIINSFNQARAAVLESGGCATRVNLIIMATRRDAGDLSSIARHLALAITAHDPLAGGETAVVGVDLAGLEIRETRAAYFAADFEPVHRCGLAVTAHAGETDDAEGIWQAVYKLHARRLGHALHLDQAPDLLRAVVERRIGVEMCPYANLQIKGFPLDQPDHPHPYPLLRYLKAGVAVTVNTDNIGISHASLSDNYLLLPRLCPGITRLDVLVLIRNALDIAFLPHGRKIPILDALDAALHRATLNHLFSKPTV